jgi:serine/threonine protein kinase/pimeloyl-ACP methyl ester carboxylesterase
MRSPEVQTRSAEPGTQIGSYILERRLGVGAMGEVWLGTHAISRGLGAVKLLRADAFDRGLMLRYFRREAQAISRLRHPHVVAVFEIGEAHIVYQFVEGQDLARRMRTPMDPAMAVRLGRQIASALAHAHERGLVHRDVKPANILLDKSGNAYLADFGLAVADGELPEASAGTPAYAAPEQWTGAKVTGAVDQYALARILCEMLAGAGLPNDVANPLEYLPAHLPRLLVGSLERALTRNASERFPSMAAFDQVLAEVDVSAYPAPVHLAPILRHRTEYVFWTKPAAVRMVSPEIVCADYRLGQLAAQNLISAAKTNEFFKSSGYAEMGFSVYASTARLGSINDPLCLARATDVVVLVHGWAATREVWGHVAPAICRDNAQAIVLVPDFWGFGESIYSSAPTVEQLALVRACEVLRQWLALLGIDGLPRVIVGHSLSATALMLSNDDDMGATTSRVALSPILPAYSEEYRKRVRLGVHAAGTIGLIPVVHRWLLRRLSRDAPSMQELSEDVREKMAATAIAAHSALFRTMFRSVLATGRFDKRAQRRMMLLIGQNDPLITENALTNAIEDLGFSNGQVVHLATGGHYPHLESAAHPEWTARNVAEIVHLVGQMLLASSQVEHPSIVDADTAMSDGKQLATDSTVIA